MPPVCVQPPALFVDQLASNICPATGFAGLKVIAAVGGGGGRTISVALAVAGV
jgi:hypothetical protein